MSFGFWVMLELDNGVKLTCFGQNELMTTFMTPFVIIRDIHEYMTTQFNEICHVDHNIYMTISMCLMTWSTFTIKHIIIILKFICYL
jgi:hypothetical protein